MKKFVRLLILVLIFSMISFVSSAPLTYRNYTISDSELEVGYTEYLAASDSFIFSINGHECKLMVSTIYSKHVKFADCKNEVDIGRITGMNEIIKLDVTLDNYYDYSVKLNEINNSKTSLTIKKINEKIPEGAKTYYYCARFYKCPNGEKVVYTSMKGSGCGSTDNPFSLCSESSEREICQKYYNCPNSNKIITECFKVGEDGSSDYGCECKENPEDECPEDTCTKYYTCSDGIEVKECEPIKSCDSEGSGKICGVKCECVENPESLCENQQTQQQIQNKCPTITSSNCPDKTELEEEKDSDGCIIKNKCIKKLSNGKNSEVKIMPETASEKAIQKLGDLGFNIELKETGKGDNTKPVYELTGKKNGRFLGIFKIRARIQTQIDANTGEIINIKKPWWSFLVTGV